MVEVVGLFERSVGEFDARVSEVGPKQWSAPTPCTDWDVRALVNHVTVEDLWVPPILHGATIAAVGDRFDGDQLGPDPTAAWRGAQDAAVRAARNLDPADPIVHLSFGDFPASFYLTQLIFDHVVHAWDLATAIGADTRLDAGLVEFAVREFAVQEDAYRSSGVIAARPPVPDGADTQTWLLAMFGRRG
ncbi:MAG: TIGR03086 family protein [Jiangellaceae bacterium]|nr:TIGR03086 family protein [Jiangellaceae bacterium]